MAPERIRPEIKERRKPRYEVAEISVPGERERQTTNEDKTLVNENLGVFGVFDGMGGHAAGAVASESAMRSVESYFEESPVSKNVQEAEKQVSEALESADDILRLHNHISKSEMGTTASVVVFVENEEGIKAVIGNVGDSRVYLLRDGKIKCLTTDDGMLEKLTLDRADMKEKQDKFSEVESRRDLKWRFFLKRKYDLYMKVRNVVTQSVGNNPEGCIPRIETVDVLENDVIIITSDGIHDNLKDSEIGEAIDVNDLHGSSQRLVDRSKQKFIDKSPRAKSYIDDRSAVIIKISA